MIEDAMKHKCLEPKFAVNGFFTATFWPNVEIARKVTEQVGEQVGTKLALSRHQVEILHNCLQEKSFLGIMSQVGRKDRTKFRTKFIKPLVESGLLEMTIPDKPRSSKQRYRTTDLGRKVLNQWNGGK
jgi:predicted transcriptional regulator